MFKGNGDPTRLRLFALLTTGFLVVGSAVCTLFLTRSLQSHRDETRKELATLAQVISLQVDAEAHEQLTDISQQNGPLYNEQVERLARALELTRDIKYVYTLRKVGNGYRFILDPTPPGDADGDGIEDRSYILDPYDEISNEAKLAYSTGTVRVDAEPYVDQWGTFISGYAPIRDSSGKVVAILGVDREYGVIKAREDAIRSEALAALALVLVLSLLLAGVLSSKLAPRKPTEEERLRLRGGLIRATAFEMTLYAAVLTVAVFGVIGSLEGSRDASEDLKQGRIAHSAYEAASEVNEHILAGTIDEAGVTRLVGRLRELGLHQQAGLLAQRTEQLVRKDDGWVTALIKLRQVLDQTHEQAHAEQQEIVARLQSRSNMLLGLFIMSTILGLGALVLIRIAARQQSELLDLLDENGRQQAINRHLVDHLPIGLFAYRDGICVYSNSSWDEQIARDESMSPWAALEARLHPDDAGRVLMCLDLSQRSRESFAITFRLRGPDGSTRHVEMRGTPVYDPSGSLEHMLAFSIDVTETVEAQAMLKEINAEVVSKNRMLSEAIAELESNFAAMVHSLVKAVEAKDSYTAGHSERVMRYSLALGRAVGLGPEELAILEKGTLIHDVGKIGVPDEVLNKPGQLTFAEYEMVKSHPLVGYKMIEGIPMFQACGSIVRWHHERLDGSGYPDGLQGDEVPILVRIAAIADAFDAMTSTRAYRRGLDAEIAMSELRREAEEGKFDPYLVEAFAEAVQREGLWPQSELWAA